MKTRAAVAFEAKRPLEIVEVDLDGPKAGEVLVENEVDDAGEGVRAVGRRRTAGDRIHA